MKSRREDAVAAERKPPAVSAWRELSVQPGGLQAAIDVSPRIVAQRRALESMFGRGVLQAVWAHLNTVEGMRLNLRANGDGTYTQSSTGRHFRRISRGSPLVVTEIVEDVSHSSSSAEEERPTRRRRLDPSDEPATEPVATEPVATEPVTTELATEPVAVAPGTGSSTELAVESTTERTTEPAPEVSTDTAPESTTATHTLTEAEFGRVERANTYRFAPRRRSGRQTLYGDDSESFRERACWNWALTGSSGDAINPSALFDMLSNTSHNLRGAMYTASFEQAWARFLPRPVEGTTAEQQRLAGQQQAAYEHVQEEIGALWARRRALNAVSSRRRRGAESDSVERISNDAVRLSMLMNGLQPADADERTPFSIAMARHPEHGVNWTHWGLEVNGHSFETIPGWGLWHQQEGFEYWANQTESIEDTQVTRVPLRGLAPGHATGVRGLLNIMEGRVPREEGSSGTRGSGRTPSTIPSTSRGGVGGPGPAVVAAPLVAQDAGGMVMHYMAIIAWANAQGTYSAEFHLVRDHPAQARLVLQNGGMTAAAALTFTQQFAAAVQHFGQQVIGYVPAPMQVQILNTLGIQEQLLAIIRYLRRMAAVPAPVPVTVDRMDTRDTGGE